MTVPYHNDIIPTMTVRRWLIVAVGVIILIIVAIAGWRWWQQRQAEQQAAAALAAAEQANAAQLATILGSPYEKIVFFSRAAASNDLFIATVDDGNTAKLQDDADLIYSNVLPEETVWYSVTDTTVFRHTTAGATSVGQLTHPVTPADALSNQPSLAVDAAEQYLAWVYTGTTDGIESVRAYNVETGEDITLYDGEPNQHYSNLTWSPDGFELAFTANTTRLITVTTDAAEIYNPISIPFTQLHYVSWIDRDHFGGVLTSTDTNPDPFSPTVAVLDRFGGVVERHAVLEKVGVPRVVWSDDGSEFLFHDPWHNTFALYDRYDQLQLSVVVKAPGKLLPVGWTSGEPYRNPARAATTTTTTTTTTTEANFSVSAEDWDRYNTLVRSILKQFAIDFSTYQVAITERGFDVTFTILPEQAEPEMIVLQTLLQTFAIIPDVPTVTIRATLPDSGVVLLLDEIDRTQAEAFVDRFTDQTLEGLFVINKQHPIGKRTVKRDKPDHHYIGDLVYSNFNDYNPYPALASLGAHVGNELFYNTEAVSLLYPEWWSYQEVDANTTLFYTGETNFASATAWSNFGVTVKRYQAPDVTFEQWLQVNRSDQAMEDIDLTLRQPLEGRHVANLPNYQDEYILAADDTVYVLHSERDAGLTEADRLDLESMVESFTDHYAFQRH